MRREWIQVGTINDIPSGGGACALIENKQIAIFANEDKSQFYAIDNLCPHKQQMVLSRGLMGCDDGEVKVACPLHKNSFSLTTGQHLGGDESMTIKTYSLKIQSDNIFIEFEKSDT